MAGSRKDINTLLEQYIAEAMDGFYTSEADASQFEAVDLDDLVKTSYGAFENEIPEEKSIFMHMQVCTTPIEPLGPQASLLGDDPLQLRNNLPKSTDPEPTIRDMYCIASDDDGENVDIDSQVNSKKQHKRNEAVINKSCEGISKPKKVRRSRSRVFSIEEIYCFQCKTEFKRPQSLKSHLIHRHGTLSQPKISIPI